MKYRHQRQDHDWRQCEDCYGLQEYEKKRNAMESKLGVDDAASCEAAAAPPISLSDCLIEVHQLMINFV
jgi:hypothetical protein